LKFKIQQADKRHFSEINRLLIKTKIGQLKEGINGQLWFVRCHGKIIACADLEIIDPQVAIFLHWAVDPDYRHQGIGTALLNHALDFARQKGIRLVALATMYYHFRRFKKHEFRTCPRQDLPGTVKDYWMFMADRYKKCAVMLKSL
jgi:N-acetylglutamate synthase-like GNAT family acetyltransferase